MSKDEKAFKLIEQITALDGVESSEVYQKSTGENVFDVLVKTNTGQLIEGTLASSKDLEIFHAYLQCVLALGDSNLRNHPNFEEKTDEQN